jgi:hypothetical protein
MDLFKAISGVSFSSSSHHHIKFFIELHRNVDLHTLWINEGIEHKVLWHEAVFLYPMAC